MGKLTISMIIFNSYFDITRGGMLFQEEITRYQLKIRDFAPPNWGFEDKEIPPGFVPGISPESVVTFMGKMNEPWDFVFPSGVFHGNLQMVDENLKAMNYSMNCG